MQYVQQVSNDVIKHLEQRQDDFNDTNKYSMSKKLVRQ